MTRAPLCRTAGRMVLVLAPLAATLAPVTADAQCIDEAIRDELNARRRYRGVRERLFQKAGRHELSVMGASTAPTSCPATGWSGAPTRST